MSKKNKETLRLQLENKYNDIRYTKQQQWHLIYLTLIAIAGITSLALTIDEPSLSFLQFLIIFEIFIGIMGGGFIISYASSMKKYRDEKDDLLKDLCNCSGQTKNCDNVIFTVCFCLVIALSLVASIWSIILKLKT